MKIVVNKAFGGYGYGLCDNEWNFVYEHEDDRANSVLVQFVENYDGKCGDLQVVEIPDTATDWEVDEYDGFESVTYVVDGKIYHA